MSSEELFDTFISEALGTRTCNGCGRKITKGMKHVRTTKGYRFTSSTNICLNCIKKIAEKYCNIWKGEPRDGR